MSAAVTYVPREGSVAQRVMAFLDLYGPSSVTTICESVEDVTRNALAASMSTAIAHGAVFSERVDGDAWYSLTPIEREPVAEIPAPIAEAAAPDAAPAAAPAPKRKYTRRASVVVPAGKLPTQATVDGHVVELSPRDAAVVEECSQPILKAEHRHATFACALFSDGRLLFEFNGIPRLTLSKEQTRALVHFLDRALHEELTA